MKKFWFIICNWCLKKTTFFRLLIWLEFFCFHWNNFGSYTQNMSKEWRYFWMRMYHFGFEWRKHCRPEWPTDRRTFRIIQWWWWNFGIITHAIYNVTKHLEEEKKTGNGKMKIQLPDIPIQFNKESNIGKPLNLWKSLEFCIVKNSQLLIWARTILDDGSSNI